MANIYYQEDCNLSLLEGKTIAVIGYGSQGHAHALNAKESGCHVIIGLYEGSKSWAKAEAQGFEVYTAAEAAKKADIIMILINDELQAAMYKKDMVRVFPVWLLFIRMLQVRHLRWHWLIHLLSVAQEQVFLRQPSVQKQRQTSLVSRQFFVVVYVH